MKPTRITFLALFTIGIIGGVSNAWQNSVGVKYIGGSQLKETFSSLFSVVGIIDYLIVPTLFAFYVSLIVAGYQKFIKPKVSRKFKIVSVLLTILAGVVGQAILILLFVSLTG
jgi:hypothetical protein